MEPPVGVLPCFSLGLGEDGVLLCPSPRHCEAWLLNTYCLCLYAAGENYTISGKPNRAAVLKRFPVERGLEQA